MQKTQDKFSSVSQVTVRVLGIWNKLIDGITEDKSWIVCWITGKVKESVEGTNQSHSQPL